MRLSTRSFLYLFSLMLVGLFSLKISSGVFQLEYIGALVVFGVLLTQVSVFIASIRKQNSLPLGVLAGATVLLLFLCSNYGYSGFYAKTITPFSIHLIALLFGVNLISFTRSLDEYEKIKTLTILLRALCCFAFVLSAWSLSVFYFYKTSIFSIYAEPLNEIIGSGYFGSGLGLPNEFVLGHKNFGAGFVLLSFPLSLALALMDKPRWKFFAIFSLVTQLLYAISCQSRGAFLAFIVGVVFVGMVVVLRVGFEKKVFLVGSSVLVFILSISLGISSVRNRLLNTFDFQNMGTGDLGRLNLLKTGWAMFLDSPFLGTGVGTVSSWFPLFWTGESSLANSYQLHCMPLQLLVEYGLVGSLIIGVVLMYPVFKAVMKILRYRNNQGRDRLVLLACTVVAILGYLTYSFTDYQLDVIPIAVFLALALGIIVVLVSEEPTNGFPRVVVGLSYAMVICLLVPLWFSGKSLYGKHLAAKAEMALLEGNSNSIEFLDKAIAVSPTQLSYLNRKGQLFAHSFKTSQNISQKEAFRKIAIECFEQSNMKLEGQWLNYYYLAWLNIGYDNEKGLAALKQAAELNSKRSHVGFILALYSRQMQNSKITKESLALEIVVNPGYFFK